MKRIIEIKRGDQVPDTAKWLKDFQVITNTRTEDNHPMLPTEEIHTYEWFDVFEISEDVPTKKIPTAHGSTMHGMGFR